MTSDLPLSDAIDRLNAISLLGTPVVGRVPKGQNNIKYVTAARKLALTISLV